MANQSTSTEQPEARRSARSSNSGHTGFTLVELLVVLGIIVLLVSILLPVVVKARRSSEVAKCLAQLRELGLATQQYLNDNENTFPDATTSNSIDSPYSPRGMRDYGMSDYVAYDPIPKQGQGTPPQGYGQGAYCMPSIAQVYARYLTSGMKVWKCPSQNTAGPALVADPVMFVARDGAAEPEDADRKRGSAGGNKPSQELRPGYRYMGTKELYYYARGGNRTPTGNPPPPISSFVPWAASYGGTLSRESWIAKNIAGVTLSQVEASVRKAAEGVVLFTDASSRIHGKADAEVWETASPGAAGGATSTGLGTYRANFVYLDGHAETHDFRDVPSYMQQFHGPISQWMFGDKVPTSGTAAPTP